MPNLDLNVPVLNASVPPREIATALFSHRRRIIAAFVIPPLIALVLLFMLPPTYRAQTELLVKTGREYLPQTEGNGSPAGPTSTKQEEINSEIALLTSRAVLRETIEKIGLKNLYPGLVDNPPWSGSVMDAAIKKLDHNVKVDPVKMSNIVDVTYDNNDKITAAPVLDTLIGVYLAKHTMVFATGREQSYEASIARDQGDLDRLEQQQSQIKIGNRIYDIALQRGALIQQRVEAQTHLQEDTDRKHTLEQRLAYLTQEKTRVPATVVSTETDHSDQMDHTQDALTDLRQSEASMLARLSPGNPEVERARAQIAALEKGARRMPGSITKVSTQPNQLALAMSQEMVMDQAELTPLVAEITRYQDLIDGFSRELDRLEKADTALRETEFKITALEDNLRNLRQHLDQARTEDELDQARMTSVVQIAPSMTPDKPAKPGTLIFLAGGVLVGLMAAGGAAVLAVTARSTFYTAIGLEKQLGLPVLASVELASARDRKSGGKLGGILRLRHG